MRMLAVATLIVSVAVVARTISAQEEKMKSANPVVIMETSLGNIKIELWADQAPVTVKNFLQYTDEKFYDGTIFHRVIPGFMIQGGGFTPDMKQKQTHGQIKNEAKTEMKNDRGTIAMARTDVVDSATCQFFINVADNAPLNHRDETQRGFGYCAFGKVTEGMDVADKIVAAQTTTVGMHKNVPVEPIVLKSVRKVEAK
jgi:cyclophilin family peptidyl-prolyl cis-trans isomerase